MGAMGCKCSCEEEKAEDSMLAAPRTSDDQVLALREGAGAAGANQDFKQSVAAARQKQKATPSRTFQYAISKVGNDEKLGFDVRHIHGKLEVVQVFAGGAIERTNKDAEGRTPKGEQLLTGDIIERVNGNEGDDNQMVEECRVKRDLAFRVTRVAAAS
uniref:PDZ domain-containing protein n=1 Tax=Spumella elongata TaxID=89044 RepID=A0A7S3HIR5_9STRA|mmetsp:Transcript_29223/g.97000  ORF Transcript_29223/g.97000 Transcript_29223/m.97000 type:complete len:158 (+) Transcript_29223:50-523(+)